MLSVLKQFYKRNHTVVGIDISASSIKLLEISNHADPRPCIQGLALEQLPKNAIEGNDIRDTEAVANCIRKAMLLSGIKSKQAVMAIPDTLVMTKVVQMEEGLNEAELEELIVMDADKYISYPIDEVNMDFEILGPSSKNPMLVDVLIVASRAENIRSRLEVATKAGLEVKVIDVESYAAGRAAQLLFDQIAEKDKNKIIAIIDIGAMYTHLYVLHGTRVIFAREEEFGGKQLIDAIAQHYSLSYEEAFQLKIDNKLPASYEEEILQPFTEGLLIQIKRTLQFFFSIGHYDSVDHIFLAGGVSGLANLSQLVQEKTGIPTSLANLIERFRWDKHLNSDSIRKLGPSLLVVSGLALRNL